MDDYDDKWKTYKTLRRATEAAFRARVEARGTEEWAARVKEHLRMEAATEAARRAANDEG